jgi:hypothetical protein
MRNLRLCHLLAIILAGLFTGACTDYGSSDPQDSGLDGHSIEDGSTQPTDTEAPYCSGPAKLELDGHLFAPVQVTSERLVMDCCDGAILRFHLAGETGFDMLIWLRFFAERLSPGEYQLTGDENAAYATTIDDPFEGQPLSGTLIISGQDTPANPLSMTLCAHATAESPPGGMRLWVESIPVMPWEWWESVAVRRLEDENLTAAQAATLPLDSLVLYPFPLLDLGALSYYDAQTHTMVLGGWRTVDYICNQLPVVPVDGLPFVIVVNEEPIYLGAFYTLFSSASFDHPVIIIDLPDTPDDRLTIDRAYPGDPPTGTPDPRPDPRLLDFLRKAGKLKP